MPKSTRCKSTMIPFSSPFGDDTTRPPQQINPPPPDIQKLKILDLWLRMEENNLALAYSLLQYIRQKREDRRPRARRPRARKTWVRPSLLRRLQQGQFHQLLRKLQGEDIDNFHGFLRVFPPLYHELCSRLHNHLKEQDSDHRQEISPAEKIAVTLRFLATGDSYRDLGNVFSIAHNSISTFVPEVCGAIIAELGSQVMIPPRNAKDWKGIAQRFQDRWNFPHVLGALDGKHIRITCPSQSGSYSKDYKGFYSIILMALVDADYRFIWVEVSANGACSDAQIYNNSALKNGLEDDTMDVPPAEPLPHDDQDIPYYIIADDSFAMKPWLLEPYVQRQLSFEQSIFNYRLSRVRRVTENAFGILAYKWGCLKTELSLDVTNMIQVVKACVCLHNLCRTLFRREHRGLPDHEDHQHNLVPGPWRTGLNLQGWERDRQGRNQDLREARFLRNYLRDYFLSPAGLVSWQENMV